MRTRSRDGLLDQRRVGRRRSGFTFLEFQVTVLVVAIGALGSAGMHSLAFRMRHEAEHRSVAILQARDMVERMRSNVPGVRAGAYGSIDSLPAVTDCVTDDPVPEIRCSVTEIARFDLGEWNAANQRLLPGPGRGHVNGPNSAGVFTVTVEWRASARDGAPFENFSLAAGFLP